MNEVEEAKQGLLVYLEANRQYIEEQMYNQFNVECIQLRTLETLDVAKMEKIIREIFDFGDNKVYQYFFEHLKTNIKQFIKEQYSSKAIASFYVLDIEKLTDIVRFCINHGFEVVAPIQKNVQSPKPEKTKRVEFIEQEQKQQQPKDQFKHVKPRISTFLDKDKIPEKREFKLQKYAMPDTNVLPRYMMNIAKAPSPKQSQEGPPEVAPLDQAYLLAHKKALRDRFEKLYNFYCIQQQSLGQCPSFERIKNQGQVMNLGKFIQFCTSTKLFHHQSFSKDMLMTEYKKAAEGKLEITFEIFEKLIIKLDEKYLRLMNHDLNNNPIPTYEARLMLNQPNKLGELKKHRNLIFGTRNKQGRQLRDRAETTRYEKKELTVHSGKFSRDLSMDLKDKPKQIQSKSPPLPSSNGPIQLKDIQRLKLPKLKWIEEEEDVVLPKRIK